MLRLGAGPVRFFSIRWGGKTLSKVFAICFEDFERRASVLETITDTITEQVLQVSVNVERLQVLG